MARVLADGKTKFTILTTKPVNPSAPTAAELNAGIDLSCDVLTSDFMWSAADSDRIDEQALCSKNNTKAIGKGNHSTGITLWRKYDVAGGPDAAAETGWAALMEKGSEVYGYARESDKDSTEAWLAADEIYLGGRVATDTPQRTDGTGFIKRKIPMEPQEMYDNIVVAAPVV